MNDTATIRARIHDSAIRRVTRTFAATLTEAFTEIFQNSRRAGATRVRVAVSGSGGNFSVTVTDDGAGIADPGVLLSFGENGWSEDLVRREDAAGMGMLSLARRGCTVSSRMRCTRTVQDGDRLARGASARAFSRRGRGRGSGRTTRRPGPAAPPSRSRHTRPRTPTPSARRSRPPPGTTPRRSCSRTPRRPRPAARRSNPAPFSTERSMPSPGRGWCSACSRTAGTGIGLNDPDVNFHGLTVSVRLPSVEAVHGPHVGRSRADIVDCSRAGARAARAQGGGGNPVPRRDARCRKARDLPRHGRRPGPAPLLSRTASARTSPTSTSLRRRPSSCPGAPVSPTSTTGASRRIASR